MSAANNERRWLREAIDKRQPIQLLGERLMGKTSLLRWVERTMQLDRPVILVVIDEVERVEDGIRAGWCSADSSTFSAPRGTPFNTSAC